ncbi:zinc finger protein 182-like [Anastrepha obliqua]|uniref:zinc finger protein 182-like n=1 Tax=Anastrepha obliqua TaxID=95512 RepID=UPI0024095E4F|nr:zinc finger protein 182-like [Anastrepha obliqua]
MAMDIEKICRTCLGLSGPLLSIYDGGGSGGGCIADMLRDFTKSKPRREDKLPEKVCLSCISEINRCYSFKLKCENSNRTLRQVVPDAPPEEITVSESKVKLVQIDKSVQTNPEAVKGFVTVYTQTKENVEVEKTHQHVQTTPMRDIMHEKSTSPILIEHNKTYRYDEGKFEKVFNAEIGGEIEIVENSNVQRKNNLRQFEKVFNAEIGGEIEIVENSNVQRKNNVRQALSLKRRRIENFEQTDIDGTEIIMEVHTEQPEENAEGVTLFSTLHEDPEEANENTTTYYQLCNSQSENENENVATNNGNNLEELNRAKNNDDELEEGVYAQFVLDDETEMYNAQTEDYNFMIYKNDSGDPEIIAKRQLMETRSVATRGGKQRTTKEEMKCAYCSMTFVSAKRLARHELKRHAEDTRKESEDVKLPIPTMIKENSKEKNSEKGNLKDDNSTNVVTAEPTATTITSSITPQPIVQKTEPSKLTYFCDTCGAGFALRRSLIHHRKQNFCNKVTYNCDICDRVFISVETLKEHKATHLQDHECTECDNFFATNDELSEHMVVVHKRNLRNQCPLCKKVFTILSALKDHLRVHSGEKPFVCDICSKGFSQKANLKQHIMRHSKEKKFKCDECSMSFVTKGELSSHKRTHTGEHPYRCDECQATFTISSSLVKHKRIHTGERPYACELCPKRFTSSFALKNHRRMHTGEKPYKCRWCNKTFTQKQDCVIHHRTHTGERNHACFCGEKFTHLGTLRTHMKTHDANDAEKGKGLSVQTRNCRAKRSRGSVDTPAYNITILDVDEDDDDADANDEKATVVTVAREDMERLLANDKLRNSEEVDTVTVSEEKLMQMTIEVV